MAKKCLAERVLGERWFERVHDSTVYKAFIDGMSSVIMGTTLGTANDYFVAGMEPYQVFHSRLAAVPVNLATGRIYGKYRDIVYRICHTTAESS